MNDYRTANDRFRPFEADNIVGHFELGHAVLVGFEIAKIAKVAFFGFRSCRGASGGIEMAACGIGVRGAAVPEFMNVKSVRTRRQTFDI